MPGGGRVRASEWYTPQFLIATNITDPAEFENFSTTLTVSSTSAIPSDPGTVPYTTQYYGWWNTPPNWGVEDRYTDTPTRSLEIGVGNMQAVPAGWKRVFTVDCFYRGELFQTLVVELLRDFS